MWHSPRPSLKGNGGDLALCPQVRATCRSHSRIDEIEFVCSLRDRLTGWIEFCSIVSVCEADEEAAQPSERPQTDNAAQPDQTATPAQSAKQDEQGNDTQDATDEPENQADDQSPQNQG
jgi:hypothetical protein